LAAGHSVFEPPQTIQEPVSQPPTGFAVPLVGLAFTHMDKV